jgi:hypothetical protein
MPARPITVESEHVSPASDLDRIDQPSPLEVDKVVESIRQDCRKAPQQYLDEVVARGYCGE